MTIPESEAPQTEAPRRVHEEFPMDLMNDLSLYETVRLERERDMHIAYARSAARKIHEGLPISAAIYYMRNEIPLNNFDRHQLVEFVNHLLTEYGSEVQFDASLNAYSNDMIISSGDAESYLQEYEEGRVRFEQETYLHFAEQYGALLMGTVPFDMIIGFARADVVSSGMDNVRVAMCVNHYLEEQKSTIRVDRYLERVS